MIESLVAKSDGYLNGANDVLQGDHILARDIGYKWGRLESKETFISRGGVGIEWPNKFILVRANIPRALIAQCLIDPVSYYIGLFQAEYAALSADQKDTVFQDEIGPKLGAFYRAYKFNGSLTLLGNLNQFDRANIQDPQWYLSQFEPRVSVQDLRSPLEVLA